MRRGKVAGSWLGEYRLRSVEIDPVFDGGGTCDDTKEGDLL